MTSSSAISIAQRLVDGLLVAGATDAVLAPGSRSGPVALALHAADAQGLLRLHVRVDERESAFLALGLASSGRVVPVLTTSGTAVGHLYPALLEALHTQTPVLAVTADRPARLRGTGANQTTDQTGLFGPVPELPSVDDIASLADRAGPWHLNVELDEPLIEPTQWQFTPSQLASDRTEEAGTIQVIEDDLRTVVIAGDRATSAAQRIAAQGGWPLLAEPSSGARFGATAVDSYAPILEQTGFSNQIQRVISVGHATLTRSVTNLLARRDLEIVHVGPPTTFPHPVNDQVTCVADVQVSVQGSAEWLDRWVQTGRQVSSALPNAAPLQLARTVWQSTGPDDVLVVGSSNPIRDLDLVAAADELDRRVLANRGLSGIDGMISTALGVALSAGRHTIVYLGDLTFLHGSNGLLIGPTEPRPDLTIVIAADDGGSIFGSLEQGAPAYAQAFERVFATPTGANIAALCAGYGVAHELADVSDMGAVLAQPHRGIRVIEVPLKRDDRRELAQRIREIAAEVVARLNQD